MVAFCSASGVSFGASGLSTKDLALVFLLRRALILQTPRSFLSSPRSYADFIEIDKNQH
jgi:hypothetical protein